jgi:hypothetical protein
MAKLFEFLDETQVNDLRDKMKYATDRQLNNLKIINNLVEKAESKHITLIRSINDITITMNRGNMMEIMSGKF